MTHANQDIIKTRLYQILRQQKNKSMYIVDLLDTLINDGMPEMDARETLLSMIRSGEIEYTTNRHVLLLDTE